MAVLKCRCGAHKSTGESMVVLHGDWRCLSCGKNNFARRGHCFHCGVSKVMHCRFVVSSVLIYYK